MMPVDSEESLRAFLQRAGRVWQPLTRSEQKQSSKVAAVLKEVLWKRAVKQVERAPGPCLFSYGSDCTPSAVQEQTSVVLGPGRTSRRSHKVSVELLIERGFVLSRKMDGTLASSCLVAGPRPMTLGKGSWQHLQAASEFFPFLRSLARDKVVISHFTFDRALFSSMCPKLLQRQAVFYEDVLGLGSAQPTGALAIQQLTDWHLFTACSCHDMHNALHWGLQSAFPDSKTQVKNLYACIVSLRDSVGQLLSALPSFLRQKMRRHGLPSPLTQPVLLAAWTALGLDSSLAETLAGWQCRWEEGALCIGDLPGAEAEGFLEELHDAFVVLLQFQPFTTSRWLTVGASCRALTAACLLGLPALVEFACAQPGASTYYLQPFRNAYNQQVGLFCASAALGSKPSDSLLLELLKDDRLLNRVVALEELAEEDCRWLTSRPDAFWAFLAASLPEAVPASTLRGPVTIVAWSSLAYMQRKCLYEVKQWPWKLLLGPLEETLEELAQVDEEDLQDMTSRKIRQLKLAGWPRQSLEEALLLLKEIRWSSTVVEQGHASAAITRRQHKQYGLASLQTRSFFHMVLALWPLEQRAAAAAEAFGRAPAKRTPQKVSGRALFLGDMVLGQVASRAPSERVVLAREVMRQGSSLWQGLQPAAKASFELRAAEQRSSGSQAAEADRQGVVTPRKGAKLGQEQLKKASLLSLAGCRLTEEDIAEAVSLLEDPSCNMSWVEKHWVPMLQAPAAPANEVRLRLSRISLPQPPVHPQLPDWLRACIKHREHFRGTALRLAMDDGKTLTLLFLLALQNPAWCSFLYLEEMPWPGHAAAAGRDLPSLPPLWECQWSLDKAQVVADTDLLELPPLHVQIIPMVSHVGHMLVSDADPMPLQSWLQALLLSVPPLPRRAQAPAEDREQDSWEALVTEFPWLSTEGDAGHWPEAWQGEAQAETPEEAGQDPPPDHAAEVQAFLQEKRAELLPEEAAVAGPKHFRHSLRGGAWLQRARGVPWDSCRGEAATSQAKAFCGQKGLAKSRTYAISRYGERPAAALAIYWCSCMTSLLEADQGDEDAAQVPGDEAVQEALQNLPAEHPACVELRELQAKFL